MYILPTRTLVVFNCKYNTGKYYVGIHQIDNVVLYIIMLVI